VASGGRLFEEGCGGDFSSGGAVRGEGGSSGGGGESTAASAGVSSESEEEGDGDFRRSFGKIDRIIYCVFLKIM